MGITSRCRTCGVPRGVTRNHEWLPNGTIIFTRNRSHRMVLLESDNLDGLFANLEKLLEKPIEETVIECKSQATRDFLQFLVKGRAGIATYLVSYFPARKLIIDLCKVMGYGKVDLREVSPRFRRAERMTMRLNDVYSLPLFCGDFKGSAELVERGTSSVDYLLESGGSYRVTAFRISEETPGPPANPVTYTDKPGDIEWDRCPSCSVPMEVARLGWDLDRGVITDPVSGRRLAIYGPAGLDMVFAGLEKEMGHPVDDLIIEAQRRHALTLIKPEEVAPEVAAIRRMLAVRGLGNLAGMEAHKSGAEMRIENPCLVPILIGVLQAAFEIATGMEATATWETTPDGDLLLQLTP
jgi:hypothetical protein